MCQESLQRRVVSCQGKVFADFMHLPVGLVLSPPVCAYTLLARSQTADSSKSEALTASSPGATKQPSQVASIVDDAVPWFRWKDPLTGWRSWIPERTDSTAANSIKYVSSPTCQRSVWQSMDTYLTDSTLGMTMTI